MLDFDRYRVLTFDCYGTLIDWETGILSALQPLFAERGITVSDEQILELYGSFESAAEKGEYRPYRMVLRNVVVEFGREFGFDPTVKELTILEDSLSEWPPFPDTVASLRAMQSRYKLGIVSNVDTDLFEVTNKSLEVTFDFLITAQHVKSYKPSQQNFEYALKIIGGPKGNILHIAQSLYHDIVPAGQLGLNTVWVDRRARKPGPGSTPSAAAAPDLEVGDLSELVRLMEL